MSHPFQKLRADYTGAQGFSIKLEDPERIFTFLRGAEGCVRISGSGPACTAHINLTLEAAEHLLSGLLLTRPQGHHAPHVTLFPYTGRTGRERDNEPICAEPRYSSPRSTLFAR